jgi:hypothetical protein
VRLQALVRGRVVRKQLTVTVKCMQALVRVQARARDRRTRLSADGRDSSQGGDALDERATHADPVKDAEVCTTTLFQDTVAVAWFMMNELPCMIMLATRIIMFKCLCK